MRQISISLSEEVDLSLLNESDSQLIDMLKEKSKANDQLPIAYNLYLVNQALKSW